MAYVADVVEIAAMAAGVRIPEPAAPGEELRPGARWLAQIHRYRLYQALMLGGAGVLVPRLPSNPLTGGAGRDASYLLRMPGETGFDKQQIDHFLRRRDRSAHDPVASRIIWVYVDFLFRQETDRSAVRAELGEDLLFDVDGRGTDAEDWLSGAHATGLSQGWQVGLVDLPDAGEAYPSLLHERTSGARPYATVIQPSRFWDLVVDRHRQIEYAVVQEAEDRLRIWDGPWTQAVDLKGRPLTPAVRHFHDKPPMVLFVADDPDPDDPVAPFGESAMRATSLVDLQILQHMSLLDDVVRKSGFPFLHVRRDPIADGPADDVNLGAEYIYAVDAEVNWVAPPRDLVEALWAHIDHLENTALKIGGVHRRSQESVEAHSGLALDWESSPIYATVHRWARRLREWETQIWRLMAIAMGRDPGAIHVVYPDDYSTRPAEADMAAADALIKPWSLLAHNRPMTSEATGAQEIEEAIPPFVRAAVEALQRRAVRRMIGSDPQVRKALTAKPEPPKPEPVAPDEVPEEVEGVGPAAVKPDAIRVAPTADAAKEAYNGAQVTALADVIKSVAMGELPAASAIAMLQVGFPVSAEEARTMVAPAAAMADERAAQPMPEPEAPEEVEEVEEVEE